MESRQLAHLESLYCHPRPFVLDVSNEGKDWNTKEPALCCSFPLEHSWSTFLTSHTQQPYRSGRNNESGLFLKALYKWW